jgi:hypothetical protein
MSFFQMISVKNTKKVKMGGFGSGKHWYYTAKTTVNNHHAIDIREWRREGLLTPGTVFSTKWQRNGETSGAIEILSAEKCVILSYRYRQYGEWKDINYSIPLDWTHCNFGNKRAWFRCPSGNCGRRVAILYGGALFACRHCHELAYPSQRENIGHRSIRKADKIRERLGWVPGIVNHDGLKPKGMHWRTFNQFCLMHNELVNLSLKELKEIINSLRSAIARN